MNKNRRKNVLIIFLLLIIYPFFLSGCSSFDKSSDNTIVNIDRPICKYYSEKNETRISFDLIVKNETIYTIDSISAEVKLFYGNTFIKQERYNIEYKIKYGKSSAETFYFNEKGKINSIEFVNSDVDYLDIYQTYKVWYISTLSVISIIIISIIVLSLFLKKEFEVIKGKLHQFLSQSIMLVITIFVPIIGAVLLVIRNNFIPFLTILTGIIIVCLFRFLISKIKGLLDKKIDLK